MIIHSQEIRETFELDQLAEDEASRSASHYYRNKARDLAMKQIEKADEKERMRPSLDPDEAREWESGMYFWPINLLK